MSRNKDRLGSDTRPTAAHAPPPQAMGNSEGGGFSFVVPTDFVELPSKGVFYPEGHPLHNKEVIAKCITADNTEYSNGGHKISLWYRENFYQQT